MKKFIVITGIALLISGCANTNTRYYKSKDILRYSAETKFLDEHFNANYQFLAKCWDENAEKTHHGLASRNTSFLKIYNDLGIAEITSSYQPGLYALLVELKKVGPEQTTINAYGSGYSGKTYLPNWMGTLRTCEKKYR